jgi:ADP-dependent NAD(P)H-hydrate dehydratase / NAD(P)H-hydrate epimerase
MQSLPTAIYAAADVRAADRFAIEKLGMSGRVLMERAAAAALQVIRERWPGLKRLLVLCGPGNNGGDGYDLARLAARDGVRVQVVAPVGSPRGGDAAQAHAAWIAAGGSVAAWSLDVIAEAGLIVDGLLGTGLQRDVTGLLADVIKAVNASGQPVLALDVPSGLDADTGRIRGVAIRAEVTVTFVGLKSGLYLGEAFEHVGVLRLATLDVPVAAFSQAEARLRRLDLPDLTAVLPRRARSAHKGRHGRVLLIGGGAGMPGALRLAGEATLRAGAGLVSLATLPAHAVAIASVCPELISHGIETTDALVPLLEAADVVAIGPGLGQDAWAERMLVAALDSTKPLIADADALNLLSRAPRARGRWVLTPHPGEAARLLGCSVRDIQADRLGAVRRLAARFDAVTVLKGAGTLVADPLATPAVCDRGNPGMAVAGMGDALTGVIAALAAQQPDPVGSLCACAGAGVLVHAMAGDRAATAQGERGILARELIAEIRACVNP